MASQTAGGNCNTVHTCLLHSFIHSFIHSHTHTPTHTHTQTHFFLLPSMAAVWFLCTTSILASIQQADVVRPRRG